MRKPPDDQIDVLFAAYGGGHVTMLRPVSQAITRHGLRSAFLGLTTAQADLEHHGLDYFGYNELDFANDAQVQAWGLELAGPEVPGSIVHHSESVAYHGLNFRDLVVAKGEIAARSHFKKNGRQGFLPVRTMEALLQKIRPRVVVATNSPRSERALLMAARNLGIPSVCVVDLFGLQEVKWIAEPGYATTICVLNEQVAEFMVARGCSPESIIITGNPAFDAIFATELEESRRELRAQRGFNANDKVLLWASNVEPERHPFTGEKGDPSLPRRIEVALRHVVRQKHNWKLIVRYHPSENVEFQPEQDVYLSNRTESLHALIHSVDAVVVMASTVGVEAHFAGRPVVSVDCSVFTADAPYSRMGISTGVTHLDDLHEALCQILAREALPVKAVNERKAATQAVAEEIIALLPSFGT